MKTLASEIIVGDEHGVHVVQSIRRVDECSRWDKDLLLSVKGTPWQHNAPVVRERAEGPEDLPGLPGPVTVVPERPDVIAEAPKAFVREGADRRIHITKRSLEKFDCTVGCPAGEDTGRGVRLAGTAHSEECRDRVQNKMTTDPGKADLFEKAETRRLDLRRPRFDFVFDRITDGDVKVILLFPFTDFLSSFSFTSTPTGTGPYTGARTFAPKCTVGTCLVSSHRQTYPSTDRPAY